LFLDRISLEDYFTYIYVPINCEFLVAQEQVVPKDTCSEVTFTEVSEFIRPVLCRHTALVPGVLATASRDPQYRLEREKEIFMVF
jgi:hypothetical protein